MSDKHKPSLGADPELFVTRNGQEIPIFGLVGGTKDEPTQVKKNPYYAGSGLAYLEDNAALEFNTPVAYSAEAFYGIIDGCMAYITNLLIAKGLDINPKCRMKLAPKYMQDPRSQEMGCVEDFIAYGPNDEAVAIQRAPISPFVIGDDRFAGGHVHVGFNYDLIPRYVAARILDIYGSLPMVGADKQETRRRHYGQASLFREKPYGIEYRPLSNFWIFKSSDFKYRMARNFFAFSHPTCQVKGAKRYQEKLMEINNYAPWHEIREAINTENEKMAADLLTHLNERYELGIYSLVGLV